jgi:hypothetical protein
LSTDQCPSLSFLSLLFSKDDAHEPALAETEFTGFSETTTSKQPVGTNTPVQVLDALVKTSNIGGSHGKWVNPAEGPDEFTGFSDDTGGGGGGGGHGRGDTTDDGFGFDDADVLGGGGGGAGVVATTRNNGSRSNQQASYPPLNEVVVHSSGGGTLQAHNMQVVHNHYHVTNNLNQNQTFHDQLTTNTPAAITDQAGSNVFANNPGTIKMRSINSASGGRSNQTAESDTALPVVEETGSSPPKSAPKDERKRVQKERNKKNEKGYLESFKDWVYQYTRWYWSAALIAVLITVVSPCHKARPRLLPPMLMQTECSSPCSCRLSASPHAQAD